MTNDNPMIPPISQAELANPDVVRVLEQALASARQGKVAGVAVAVALGPGSISMSVAGGFPCELIAGCAQITKQLTDNMFNPKQRTSLMIPRRQ